MLLNLPFDKDLVNQDPERFNEYYARMVSIHHIMRWIIQPEQLIITREIPPPPVEPPPDVEPPEAKPDTGTSRYRTRSSLPWPWHNLRVGDVTQSGDERVSWTST